MTTRKILYIAVILVMNNILYGQVIDSPSQVNQHKPVQKHPRVYSLTGKILNGKTGEPVPFAIVFFPHSSLGTAADEEGNFTIVSDSLPGDTVRYEAMGYSSSFFTIGTGHEYHVTLKLDPTANALNEEVIHAGEDPAVRLIKQVIAKKPVNDPDRWDNYSYEAYNRMEADLQHMTREEFSKIPLLRRYSFIFDNLDSTTEDQTFLPLYLTESISDYYYSRSPSRQREFIKANSVKGVKNENVDKYLGALHQKVDVYHNYIPVFDKKYVSPVNNDALFYYKYKITDSLQAYGHRIYQLQFRARRPGENCFTGAIWVVDSVFALQRCVLNIPKTSNLNWVDKASLYQEFAPVDTNWFISKEQFTATFSAYKLKKVPAMIGRKTTTYHHVMVNRDTIDAVLSNREYREEVIKSDSARKRTDEWWANNRPDQLTTNEAKINKTVDSINNMPITTFYKNAITFLATGVKDIGPLQLGPYFYLFSQNAVEGYRFRISLGTPRKIKNVHLTGFLAYGTRDEKYKYGATGIWVMKRHPWTYLYGYYIHDIDQSTNYYDQLGSDNIFSSLARKPGIPWKLAFSDEQRLEFYKEYFSGFSHRLVFQHRDYTPYAPLPYLGIFYDAKGRPAPDVVSSQAQLELRYAFREHYIEGLYTRMDLGSKYPICDLQLTEGFKNLLGGNYAYKVARLSLSEDINIPPLGHLHWNVFSGKYFGTLPYPLLEIHPGNEYYYYNQFAFEMMNTYEFISDQYAGLMMEHTVGSGVFQYIPALKRMKLRQFWTAKGIIGSLSDANQQLNLDKGFPFRTLQGNPYVELGTGISNIFQLFRIDFDWRVAPTPLPSEAKMRYFGVFGSMIAQF